MIKWMSHVTDPVIWDERLSKYLSFDLVRKSEILDSTVNQLKKQIEEFTHDSGFSTVEFHKKIKTVRTYCYPTGFIVFSSEIVFAPTRTIGYFVEQDCVYSPTTNHPDFVRLLESLGINSVEETVVLHQFLNQYSKGGKFVDLKNIHEFGFEESSKKYIKQSLELNAPVYFNPTDSALFIYNLSSTAASTAKLLPAISKTDEVCLVISGN